MSNNDIIYVWKEKDYRENLSEQQCSQLPENLAGIIEVAEQALRFFYSMPLVSLIFSDLSGGSSQTLSLVHLDKIHHCGLKTESRGVPPSSVPCPVRLRRCGRYPAFFRAAEGRKQSKIQNHSNVLQSTQNRYQIYLETAQDWAGARMDGTMMDTTVQKKSSVVSISVSYPFEVFELSLNRSL